jgi:hypothetical protein
MTFGISHLPRKDIELLPFYPHVPRVLQGARSAPGFTKLQPKLGDLVHPRFYDEDCQRKNLEVSQVLFLWDDIEAVLAFSYNGIHREALRINKENAWFLHSRWPPYVAWWTQMHEVRWDVGCRKLEHLQDHGSTPDAFNFHLPFDIDGKSYRTDHDRLRRYRSFYA